MGLANDQLGAAELNEIQSDNVGSVWFVATSYAGVAGIRQVSDNVQAQATPGATGGVRFFVAANQEGGVIQAMQGPGFSRVPSAVIQGNWTTSTLESQASTWAQQLRAAGVNLNFAPVMDVVPSGFDSQNQPIGVLQREYGHDPSTVARQASAFLRGMHQAGVAVTIKHFPGLGRVLGNTDNTTATDTLTTASDPYLASFKAGVDAGADNVMVALATYTRIDTSGVAAFSPIVIRQMLRTELGFQGVVMSDDLGATAAVASIPAGQRALDFLAAGGDFIVSKTAAATHAMVTAIRSAVGTDVEVRGEVDAAALLILREKQTSGLLPC